MAFINLKDFYAIYTCDCFVEVSDDLQEALLSFKREEESYQRQRRRYKAYYSLDRNDGIEHASVIKTPSVEDTYEQKAVQETLYKALSALSDKQAKRINARYVLGLSVAEIARIEGVRRDTVEDSIQRGIRRLKNILKNK